jgi:mono/diheme cytochrome c family protein
MKRIAVLLTFAALAFTVHGDDAAALYTAKCAMCHGATGAGDTPMGKKLALKALGSAEVQKKDDADLVKVIAKGSGKMPAFASKISDAQIKQLVAVIRGFAKK